MVVFSTPSDGGVAVGAYAPLSATTPGGVTVDITTAYPFDDIITVTVSGNNMASTGIPVRLRVPGWASSPDKTLNGKPITAANGTMLNTSCVPQAGETSASCTFVLDFKPQIRVEEWGDFAADGSRTQAGPYSIHRGPLLYGLPLGLNFTQTAHYFGPANDTSQSSNDYEVRATNDQSWNVAIDIADIDHPEASLVFHQVGRLAYLLVRHITPPRQLVQHD